MLAIAEPARRKTKLPAEEMRRVIRALCEGRWLTAKDIGNFLARDAKNIQIRFLTALVRAGELELRFPEVPNRPDQAYRTRSSE